MEELINNIKEVQFKYGLSDRQFSLKLKISPGLWCKVKKGKNPPGAKFLGALSENFPELDYIVLRYMKSRGQ